MYICGKYLVHKFSKGGYGPSPTVYLIRVVVSLNLCVVRKCDIFFGKVPTLYPASGSYWLSQKTALITLVKCNKGKINSVIFSLTSNLLNFLRIMVTPDIFYTLFCTKGDNFRGFFIAYLYIQSLLKKMESTPKGKILLLSSKFLPLRVDSYCEGKQILFEEVNPLANVFIALWNV